MNIHLENVNVNDNSGPNSFARKLTKYMEKRGHTFKNYEKCDANLCFIESFKVSGYDNPLFLRLDGIYFNITQEYGKQNANIKNTYDRADGVIIQSEFDKKLILKHFGEHPNVKVIQNGADTELIGGLKPLQNRLTDEYDSIWACASAWRPHKRLKQNIHYFLEHSGKNDCLIVAGNIDDHEKLQHENVYYVGNLDEKSLLRLYRTSKHFIHLAWLDHCPNVVVDAKAAGCQIICSSAGGTAEVVGKGDIIVEEDEWDFQPTELYNPPRLDFSRKRIKEEDVNLSMENVAEKYEIFIKNFIGEINE